MQEKTMRWALKNKTEGFVNALPEDLQKDVRENLFVAGGAIASMVEGYDPNDYDVYIADSDVLERLTNHLINEFIEKERKDNNKSREAMPKIDVYKDENNRVRVKIKSSGIASQSEEQNTYDYFEQRDPLIGAEWVQTTIAKSQKNKSKKVDYVPTFITENSISLGNADMQIITRFSGPAEEVVNSFDFDHTRNYYMLKDNKIVWNTDALKSLITKTLKYKGSEYPLCALIRSRKFLLRGFKCPVDIYVRLAFELNQLDLTDPKVLADQLIGVDFAYFVQLIKYIEADLHKNPDMKISNTYICQVLDELEDKDLGSELQQLDIMQQEIMGNAGKQNEHDQS